MKQTYKNSGVDVEAGDRLVEWLQKDPGNQAWQSRLVDGVGGFAALFRADFPQMKKPCMVACTDGVGTKVILAAEHQRLRGIGQDLVAMCVNDLICTGGVPLFFLDYYAVAKLDEEQAKEFLTSVRQACVEAECALIGGETAEMPGVYRAPHFDCAGFAIGMVDEDERLGAQRVRVGDVLLGVSSSGFHSNGYSLLRKLFEKDLAAWLDILMKPTALYVKLAKALMASQLVNAIAHITGGGMENVPRVLPKGTQALLKTWPFPEPFLEVQRRSEMSAQEMLESLNCGVGLVLAVSPINEPLARAVIENAGFEAIAVGRVIDLEDPSQEASVDYSAWTEL